MTIEEEASSRVPIVTVPKHLSFSGNKNSVSNNNNNNNNGDDDDDAGYPVYLTEDWDSGIGGGLWTTGLALGRYFATSPQFLNEFEKLRIRKAAKQSPPVGGSTVIRALELGSGNGFLGVVLVAAVAVAQANKNDRMVAAAASDSTNDAESSSSVDSSVWPGIEVVVTDTAEHLPLMRETIESNLQRILPQIIRNSSSNSSNNFSNNDIEKIASVEEYLWGEDYDFGESNSNSNSSFDLIIGSDVAYRDHLHDPLIAALDEFCVPNHTIALIGVTMNDTKPIFFQKLTKANFVYEKLADHLLGDDFANSSRQFGIFCISKLAE